MQISAPGQKIAVVQRKVLEFPKRVAQKREQSEEERGEEEVIPGEHGVPLLGSAPIPKLKVFSDTE